MFTMASSFSSREPVFAANKPISTLPLYPPSRLAGQLIGAVRVGHGLTQSLEWVGQQMPPPAGGEFERVIREIQLGQSLPNALDNMVRRVDSDDLGLIVTAIKIQHESGGSLAEISAGSPCRKKRWDMSNCNPK